MMPAGAARPERRGSAGGRLRPMLLVAAVAAASYFNAVANGFALDDNGVIAGNALVHGAGGVWRAFGSSYWPAGGGGQYRPLAIASYAIDWVISGGSAHWMHLVNIGWHAAASVLVFLLLAELVAPAAAVAGALVFAVHPLHVEAVANIVGRAECMAAVFVLAGLLAHRRCRWTAPLWFALAIFSKESAIVFVGLVVLHDALLADAPFRTALRRRMRLYGGYGVVIAVFLAAFFFVLRGEHALAVAPVWRQETPAARILTMLSLVPRALRLLLLPLDLSSNYGPQVTEPVRHISLAVRAGLAVVAFWLAAIACCWRTRPRAAFALCWLPVTIAPVSNILFPTGIVMAERTLYLPSVALSLGISLVWQEAAGRLGGRVPRAAWAALALLLLGGSARDWQRTPSWRDNRTVLLALLAEHPESYEAHRAAAQVHAYAHRFELADGEYRLARRLFQGDPTVYAGAAVVAMDLGDFGRAGALLDTTLALDPRSAAAMLWRADAHFHLGEYAAAVGAARRALRLAPDSTRADVIIASAQRALGNPAAARETYASASRRHPGDWTLHAGYAQELRAAGDLAGARREAARAVELSGGDSTARQIALSVTAPASAHRDPAGRRGPGARRVSAGAAGAR